MLCLTSHLLLWRNVYLNKSKILHVFATGSIVKSLNSVVPAKLYQTLSLPPTCKVTYCHTVEDCTYTCDSLLSRLKLPVVVGYDAEWTFVPHLQLTKNIAVLQLCISPVECYIFHLSQMNCVPPPLQSLIFHQWVVKVGFGVKSDIKKLINDYSLPFEVDNAAYVDVSSYAIDIGIGRSGKSCWSMKKLSEMLLKQTIDKQSKIRLGDWENFPLDDKQISYAAIDAYASLLLFKSLDKIRTLRDARFSYPYLSERLKRLAKS